jgi:hypothetical protein
LSHKISKPKCK